MNMRQDHERIQRAKSALNRHKQEVARLAIVSNERAIQEDLAKRYELRRELFASVEIALNRLEENDFPGIQAIITSSHSTFFSGKAKQKQEPGWYLTGDNQAGVVGYVDYFLLASAEISYRNGTDYSGVKSYGKYDLESCVNTLSISHLHRVVSAVQQLPDKLLER